MDQRFMLTNNAGQSCIVQRLSLMTGQTLGDKGCALPVTWMASQITQVKSCGLPRQRGVALFLRYPQQDNVSLLCSTNSRLSDFIPVDI